MLAGSKSGEVVGRLAGGDRIAVVELEEEVRLAAGHAWIHQLVTHLHVIGAELLSCRRRQDAQQLGLRVRIDDRRGGVGAGARGPDDCAIATPTANETSTTKLNNLITFIPKTKLMLAAIPKMTRAPASFPL